MTTVLLADSAVIDFRNALAAGGVDVGPVTDLLVDAMRHVAPFYTIAQAGMAPLVLAAYEPG